jgi:hypothetical protein
VSHFVFLLGTVTTVLHPLFCLLLIISTGVVFLNYLVQSIVSKIGNKVASLP